MGRLMRDEAFQVVPMHIARNPVARAYGITRMRRAGAGLPAAPALPPYDQEVHGDVHCAIRVLTVCLLSLEELGRADGAAARVMRGAQATLLQCVNLKGRWRPGSPSPSTSGLQRAVEDLQVAACRRRHRARQRSVGRRVRRLCRSVTQTSEQRERR